MRPLYLTAPLILLVLGSCRPSETSVNKTHILGTATIPAQQWTEQETVMGENDSHLTDVAENLGLVGYRQIVVQGVGLKFAGTPNGEVNGDFDYYRFSPVADGSVDLGLIFDGGETTVFVIRIYEVDPLDNASLVAEYDTIDYDGAWTGSMEVKTGARYAVAIGGKKCESETLPYSLTLSGFDPNTTAFLVGAYQNGDAEDVGALYGGTSIPTWELGQPDLDENGDPKLDKDGVEIVLNPNDWFGDYEILFLQEIITCDVTDAECTALQSNRVANAVATDTGTTDTGATDTGAIDTGTTDTGTTDTGTTDTGTTDTGGSDGGGDGTGDGGAGDTAATEDPTIHASVETVTNAWLMVGNFANLTSGVTSTVHYGSQLVEVTVGPEEVLAALLSVDSIQPISIGFEYTEAEEPGETGLNEYGEGETGLDLAESAGEAFGPPYTDFIYGSLLYSAADDGESDLFSFTVPEPMGALFTATWGSDSYNSDLYLLDSEGNTLDAAYVYGDTNPESFNSLTGTGMIFEPGETYYLLVYPYTGPAGECIYTIKMEWQLP